jgi:hypothetical protein
MKCTLLLGLSLLVSQAPAFQRTWQVVDGVAVIEAELADSLTDGFTFDTETPGYLGAGYIRSTAPNRTGIALSGAPSGSVPVTYRVNIPTAGVYTFEARARKDGTAPDLSDDFFLKQQNGNFVKHVLEGNDETSMNRWLHDTLTEPFDQVFVTQQFVLEAGTFDLTLAMRSNGLKLDRFYLYTGTRTNESLDALADTSTSVERIWQVVDGVAVLEAEVAGTTSDNWVAESTTAGFLGSGYIRHNAPARTGFTFVPPLGLLPMRYKVNITTAGTYNFEFRARKDGPAPDLWDDVFLRRANGVFTKHVLEGDTNESVGRWLHDTETEPTDQVFVRQTYTLQPGLFELAFYGRSESHKIDRIYLYSGERTNQQLDALADTSGFVPPVRSVSYDFQNQNANGAEFFSVPGTFAEPFGNIAPEGLSLVAYNRADNNAEGTGAVFGGFTIPVPEITINSGDNFVANFFVTTNANADQRDQIPTFRVRLFDSNLTQVETLAVETGTTGLNSPVAGELRIYTLNFTVPEGVSNGTLSAAFDYIFPSGSGNDPNISVTLQEMDVTKQ